MHLRFLKTCAQEDMGVPGGGGGSPPPPSLLGKQSQSGNIRFTVGQYWLIIKINGTNFVGNSVNFVGNMLSNRNFLRKNFFDNSGTIRKSRANFFPSRTPMQEDVKHDWNLRLEGKIKMCMFHSMFK